MALALAGCDLGEPGGLPEVALPSVVTPVGEPWFEEVSEALGIDFRHRSGHRDRHYMPEINAGGVGLLDYDGDGWLDVICVDGGSVDPQGPDDRPRHRIYRNLGGERFEDVTAAAGLADVGGYGLGVACADFDGDGWVDIYLLNLGANRLFRNLGDGRFADVTEAAGVGGDEWSSSAAFFDYDRDGYLDLVVVNYLYWTLATEVTCTSRGGEADYCSPLSYGAPAMDRLYRNRGDGTFEDVTRSMGWDGAFGNGLGVAVADVDGDGWLDVFVANDATPNQLWMNREGRVFVDEAMVRGCALNSMGIPRAGMGVVAVDILERGWWDFFVTHLVSEGNGWFLNREGRFVDHVTSQGPTVGSWPYTGFGVAFRDFDHDGLLDLYVANGRVRLGARDLVPGDPYAEPNTLRRGMGGGTFKEVLPLGGTDPVLLGASRGMAVGDLDNDGAEDVILLNKDGPVHVLRNLAGSRGGRWIGLEVRDAQGRMAHHARVRLESGGRVQHRQVQPNDGYASSHDGRLVFGLGSAEAAEKVTIRWLDGSERVIGPLEAGRYHEVRPGGGVGATP